MAAEDIDDPIALQEYAIRVEMMLVMLCDILDRKAMAPLMPDNIYDWWAGIKSEQEAAQKLAIQEAQEAAKRQQAMAKLTPDERRLLGLE